MKVQTSIKKRSTDDQIVRRRGVLFRINKKNPRNKARQPLAKPARKAKRIIPKRKVQRMARKRRTGSKM